MEPAVIAMERLTVCGVKQTRFYFFYILAFRSRIRITSHVSPFFKPGEFLRWGRLRLAIGR
jgi:hypothetical protein